MTLKESSAGLVESLLGRLQVRFPVVREPFVHLAGQLGISPDQVLAQVGKLKAEGVIRQIGPIVDAGKLGYRSTLVALKIPEEQIASAERFIMAHPCIGHAYVRTHKYNVWLTLAIPPGHRESLELQRLLSGTGAIAIMSLPARKVFKLRAVFGTGPDTDGNGRRRAGTGKKVALSDLETAVMNEIQRDLPLEGTPFDPFAAHLGIGVSTLLATINSLIQRGVIRRYGAAVNHRRVGYTANGMACWEVPPDRVAELGRELASLGPVSHCYERKPVADWPYNVFAMIHAHSRQECLAIVESVTQKTGMTKKAVLFSTKEIRKTRVLYPV